GVVRSTVNTTGVMRSRTGVGSTTSTENPSRPIRAGNSSKPASSAAHACLTCSRSWRRTSVRLTTPTGRPAWSITGAAPKPRSTKRAMASRTVASARSDTGLGDIRSAAVAVVSVRHGFGGVIVFMDLLLHPDASSDRRRDQGREDFKRLGGGVRRQRLCRHRRSGCSGTALLGPGFFFSQPDEPCAQRPSRVGAGGVRIGARVVRPGTVQAGRQAIFLGGAELPQPQERLPKEPKDEG